MTDCGSLERRGVKVSVNLAGHGVFEQQQQLQSPSLTASPSFPSLFSSGIGCSIPILNKAYIVPVRTQQQHAKSELYEGIRVEQTSEPKTKATVKNQETLFEV
jgi:hypothetical protein